ncbi:MAG: universal stress protein [Nevskia sp.]|nr:universal stress protein [Nevskia sp.]
MKRILVAIDGSNGAARALQFACDISSQCGGRLWLVNVISNFGLAAAELEQFREAEGGSISDLLESLSTQVLQQARQLAQQRGIHDIELVSRTGDVAGAIVEVAEDCSADVIVLGRRGHGLMPGLMLGSVSQKLASAAPRPVIVVP